MQSEKQMLRRGYYRCIFLVMVFLNIVSNVFAEHRQDSLLVVADSIMLKELTITALKPVSVHGDTIIYDVSAFSVPEGSHLRELLQRLPGIEVSADGNIRAQGVQISYLLLNGRDFFSANRSVMLDNLPVDALLNVRVYERVQEDEEDTGMRARTEHVMDLTTEPSKSKGWFVDFTGAGGYNNRYSGNASASHFDDVWQNMLTLSSDNLPQTFGIGESFYEKVERTLQEGDSRHHNFSTIIGRKSGAWETSGSAYYSSGVTTRGAESLTENLLTKNHLFSRSSSSGEDRTHNVTTNFHLERRDSMTTITIDPQFSWSKGWGFGDDLLVSSSSRPIADVLTNSLLQSSTEDLLNRQSIHSSNNFQMWNALVNAHLRRRLGRHGRTFTASASWELNDLSSHVSTESSIEYYNPRSYQNQIRHSDSPDRDWKARLHMSWIEPLSSQVKLKAEYGVSYRHESMKQDVYTETDRSDSLSKYADYDYVTQSARLLMQWSPSDRLYLSLGGQYNPVRTNTRYVKNKMNIDTVRTVHKWAPEFNFYYRSDNGWNFTVNYSGVSRQPSLLNLLPIKDDSDPLHIREGNPGLKPSFLHQVSSTFFWFEPESQTQLNLQIQGQWEYNAIVDVVDVDGKTGVRHTSYDNVDGCRQVGGIWTMSTNFYPNSCWTLDFQGDLNIVRRVGLQERHRSNNDLTPPTPASPFTTQQSLLRQYMSLQWRLGSFSIKPYAFFSYNGLRAYSIDVNPADLWLVGTGLICLYETNNGWSAGIDASRQSRRGYVDAVDNDDEWLIDFEVAYSFLKGRAAEVRFQACDLLRQHNLSRSVTSATERMEATYPLSITNYLLLSFTYRFSVMGK